MAKTMRVTWVEKRQFVGTDDGKHTVVMSSQDKENGTGISPSALLLAALGGCTAYDVVSILEKKRRSVTWLEVIVTGEQDEEPPWAYRRIHVRYVLRGEGLDDKAVQDAIRLSEEKYCSVAATLRPRVEMSYEYSIE
jgi:putative redox protein